MDNMTLTEWLDFGIEQGWVSPPHCGTHDGIASTEAEEIAWEDGDDPCQPVLRLWETAPLEQQ